MTSLITLDQASPLPPVPASPLVRTRALVLAGSALIAVFVVGFGTWSVMAPLESAAVAMGAVVSESSRKTVQHLEGGIISAILVHDGDEVAAGQTLIRLDDTKARTTLLALRGQLWDAKAREARLIAERDHAATIDFPADLVAQQSEPAVAAALAGQQKIFDARRSLVESKTAAIRERINQVHEEINGHQAEVAALETRVKLLQEEVGGVRQLVAGGLERKSRLLQLERDLADADGKRGDTLAQIARAKQTIAEAEIDILSLQNDRQKDVADELRETQKKGHELAEQVQAAADVLARDDVRAPENGIITDLRVHTPGGVVTPGEALLDLVPEADRLVVEVQVRPEDIDRVHEGLPAQVRLLPYKQRRTPMLNATVTYVSADHMVDKRTERPYYTAKLRIDEKELAALGNEVKMVPGMPSEAMIQTGETTVAAYALAPILDSFHRAFREK
jgi:membrane fusion protein, type I secretion system